MSAWLVVLFVCLFSFFYSVLSFLPNDPYDVVGVQCGINEEVGCTMVTCPLGYDCPAEDYCFNPTCVCRFGYRKVNGKCVVKHRFRNLKAYSD